MANTFLTSDFVVNAARDAAILLSANLVASNLVSRQIEGALRGAPTVGPSGGSVQVKVIAADTANTQDHTGTPSALTVTDVTESAVTVNCLHYVYIKKSLNVKEKTWELDDFTRKFTAPAMVGIANEVDQYLIRRITGGFARNLSGTAGTDPSTTSNILAARKVLQDNLVPVAPRVAILGTQAEASFLGIDQFTNRDYGEDGADALRRAALSTRYGVNWYVDQNVGTFVQGDVAGTVLTNGAGTVGASSLAVDGFDAATGTVREGTAFTVAGDSTRYVVTDDTAIVSNAATLPIAPVASANIAAGGTSGDNAAITFETPFTQDCVFHPGMVAGAIVAPQPLMSQSAVASFNGLSVRVSFESTISDGTVGSGDFVLYDVYCGGKVIRPEGGVIMQGSSS